MEESDQKPYCCHSQRDRCCNQTDTSAGCRHGRNRRRRLLGRGELQLALLALFEKGDNHGYGLLKELESMSGGAYTPSPGVLYPTLNLLEDQALITQNQTDESRKGYHLTQQGLHVLNSNRKHVEALFQRLSSLNEERLNAVWQPLERLSNLLQSQLFARSYAQSDVTEIEAVLNQATETIENLLEK